MHCVRQNYVRILVALTFGVLVLLVSGMTTPAQAQTFTDLYDFNAGAGDPTVFNSGRLAQGRDGNFYAESQAGGTSNAGTVFKITTTGTLTIRHSFDGTDGASPDGGMSLGLDGSLYGDATRGGSSNQGTAIKITPSGTFTVLHNFTDPGAGPFNALVQGTNGSFYGTTNITSPGATIYSVTSTGTFATVHTLTASEGYEGGQLSIGNDGNIYRAMNLGGTNGFGTAFKMTPGGVFTVLHNFTGTDGANAAGGMVQAFNGKFYGAASNGGSSNAGVIYSLTSSGTFTVLHILNGTTDGFDPYGQIIVASDGNMYGPTNSGGNSGCGTIFKVTPAGSYSVVYNFDGTHACNPQEQLTQRTDGILYGIANGGAHNNGVFYSLNIGLSPFASLGSTSGKIGAKIGILGQGFSNASVVKFGGVEATSITRSGTTFISATVPAGALTGPVTVTTGTTTLTSPQSFKVKPTITSFAPPAVRWGLRSRSQARA